MKTDILHTGLIAAIFALCPIFQIAASEHERDDTVSLIQELQEVTVTAQHNLFKIKGPNKFIYEVYSDSTLKGANTLDALAQVPILAVRKTGGVEALNGKELVFKINGLNDPLLKSLSQALTTCRHDIYRKFGNHITLGHSGTGCKRESICILERIIRVGY